MDIATFKKQLEDGIVNSSYFVFVEEHDTSRVISNQYLERISNLLGREVKYIDGLSDIPDTSFIEDLNLYVIECDQWNYNDSHDNLVVICKDCKEGIVIPKLESWQVVDYVLNFTKVPNEAVTKMCNLYGEQYFQNFINDMKNVSLFEDQDELFNSLDYNVYNNGSTFDLVNAIMERRLDECSRLVDKNINALAVCSLLYKKFKQLLIIVTNINCTPEEAGCKSDKQLYWLRKNSYYYSVKQIERNLRILSNVEKLFKLDGVEMDMLLEYIICKILED